jgi:hypothetical protein
MKHGDVLVKGEFEPFRWGQAEKFHKLSDVEVVAWSEEL